jgi:hypothetical protein
VFDISHILAVTMTFCADIEMTFDRAKLKILYIFSFLGFEFFMTTMLPVLAQMLAVPADSAVAIDAITMRVQSLRQLVSSSANFLVARFLRVSVGALSMQQFVKGDSPRRQRGVFSS